MRWTAIFQPARGKSERTAITVDTTRLDLQIRALLDDPALRRAMGLDQPPSAVTECSAPADAGPRRRSFRRRLLQATAPSIMHG